MKLIKKEVLIWLKLIFVCHLCLTGCQSYKNDLITAAASGGGAVMGYSLSKKKAMGTAIGAVSGYALSRMALGKDQATYQKGFDEGYLRGRSDSIKRQYWVQQAMHKSEADSTRLAYYTLPGEEKTEDGSLLMPHDVCIPIIE